jgi:predicted Zn-dependent peptidase
MVEFIEIRLRERICEQMAALKAETMPRLVRRYFNTENYVTGILLPEDR